LQRSISSAGGQEVEVALQIQRTEPQANHRLLFPYLVADNSSEPKLLTQAFRFVELRLVGSLQAIPAAGELLDFDWDFEIGFQHLLQRGSGMRLMCQQSRVKHQRIIGNFLPALQAFGT